MAPAAPGGPAGGIRVSPDAPAPAAGRQLRQASTIAGSSGGDMNRRAWLTGRPAVTVSAACLAAVITAAGPATAGTTTPPGAAVSLPGGAYAAIPGAIPVPAAAAASDPHGSDLSAVTAV